MLLAERTLLLGCLLVASCGGGSIGVTGGVSMCGHPSYLDDAGVGTGGCVVKRAALFCESPTQGGCDCVTDDATCGCNIPCENKCHAKEYAASCGGPPAPPPRSVTYADPPPECRSVGAFPSGGSFYCCPCR